MPPQRTENRTRGKRATGETAVQTALAAGFPKTKAWRAKPATPLQAPGPDVRLARTHGPGACIACFVSFVSLVISKTRWQSCVR